MPFSPLLSTWSCPSSLCSHGLRIEFFIFQEVTGAKADWGRRWGHPKALIRDWSLRVVTRNTADAEEVVGGRSNRKGGSVTRTVENSRY